MATKKAPAKKSTYAPWPDDGAAGIQIRVKPINWQRVSFRLVGFGEGLLCHQFSEKAKEMMREKMRTGRAPARESRDPEALFQASLYYTAEHQYGFPSQGIKDCFVAGIAMDDPRALKKAAERCIFVDGVGRNPCLVPVIGEPEMDERNVKLMGPGRPADLRIRGLFTEWEMPVSVRFCETYLRLDDLVNGMNRAGQMIGLGGWRPDRGGTSLGMFNVLPFRDGEEVS